jgi:hypothetical protein
MTRLRTLLVVGALLATTVVVGPVTAEDGQAVIDDAIAVAKAHMAEQFPTDDRVDVAVTDAYTSTHNEVTHVYLRQTVDGTQVLGADATVNVVGDDVVFEGNRFRSDLGTTASGEELISQQQAVRAAAADRDATPDDLMGAPSLAYQVLDDGRVRLVHVVELVVPNHWWNVSVDAQTGEVVHVEDWVDSEDAVEIASRFVRESDADLITPLLDAPDTTTPSVVPDADATDSLSTEALLPPDQFIDGSAYTVFPLPLESPLDGGRETVENPADAVASPNGWHDIGGVAGASTTTEGNNVIAYADTVENNSADPLSQPDGGEDLQFDFPLLTTDATPAIYRDAAVTNLFYWSNVVHDITFRYGFDEAAGNFQTRNLTGLGEGGDPVLAEAQDGGGVLNANFATPPDGSSGRMQMYLWVDAFRALSGDTQRVPSTQVRDGDLDAGVIAHEIGHGISNRLVGGPSNVSCLRTFQQRQGEGWSDWWSFALTMRAGDDGATPRGIGNYVTYYDEDGRDGKGIRITPYSTDLTVNPSTFETIRGAAAPHGVGYVWATMLWDMYWNLVEVHGFEPNPYGDWTEGGNNLAMQLVVDSMKFSQCSPGFADARDAIIAADQALTGDPAVEGSGENFCLIWETFARRGLGVDADQGDPANKSAIEDGFGVPAGCTPVVR